jgi:hypothetical protein
VKYTVTNSVVMPLVQVKSMFTYTDAIPTLMRIILQSTEEQVIIDDEIIDLDY